MTHERTAYRFKHGDFKGMTVEHMMLRYAPDLCSRAKWASDKPHLSRLVKEVEQLRTKLRQAPIVVHCARSGCERTPIEMTLPLGGDGYYRPDPSFWCRKHESRNEDEISWTMPISFDAMESFDERKNRSAVHRSVLKALGIKRRSRITEEFAHEFFASLD
jgi:hypothetical protein